MSLASVDFCTANKCIFLEHRYTLGLILLFCFASHLQVSTLKKVKKKEKVSSELNMLLVRQFNIDKEQPATEKLTLQL